MVYLDSDNVVQLINSSKVEGILQLVHNSSDSHFEAMKQYDNWIFVGAPYRSEFPCESKESLIAHYLSMGQEFSIKLDGKILEIGNGAKIWWDYKD